MGRHSELNKPHADLRRRMGSLQQLGTCAWPVCGDRSGVGLQAGEQDSRSCQAGPHKMSLRFLENLPSR